MPQHNSYNQIYYLFYMLSQAESQHQLPDMEFPLRFKPLQSTNFKLGDQEQLSMAFPQLVVGESSINSQQDIFSDHEQYQKQKNAFPVSNGSSCQPMMRNQLTVLDVENKKQISKKQKQVNQGHQESCTNLDLQNPLFKTIMKKKNFKQKNGNTIRFLIDLAVQFLPLMKDKFELGNSELIFKYCADLRSWHLEKKKNVYNRQHLERIFGEKFELAPHNAKQTRRVFSQILRNYALQAMKRPRSQIKDQVHYLKVAKIFNLRCRNDQLSQRNQTR